MSANAGEYHAGPAPRADGIDQCRAEPVAGFPPRHNLQQLIGAARRYGLITGRSGGDHQSNVPSLLTPTMKMPLRSA
jgi:hypothetical protein